MTSRWIRRRYGFGAARLCLAVEPVAGAPESGALVREIQGLLEELLDPGSLRALGSLVFAGALLSTAVLAVIATLERERVDSSELVIVRALPDPREVLAPEPPQAVPPPPVPLVAASEPEAIEPQGIEPQRIEPQRIEPNLVASVHDLPETKTLGARVVTEPPPVSRPTPPPPAARPAIAIDPIAAPVLKAESERMAAPRPAFRASRHTESRKSPPPTLRIDPVASVADSAASEPAQRVERSVRTPPATAKHSLPRPRVASISPLPALPAKQAWTEAPSAPTRSGVRTRVKSIKRVRPAGLRPSGPTPIRALQAVSESPPPTFSARASRDEVAGAAGAASIERATRLAAIPLSSLDACVTDREEDKLKMAVVSAAGGRSACTSAAGRYRFVETKNLAAFLMFIERVPSRKHADRCGELRLALACLRG